MNTGHRKSTRIAFLAAALVAAAAGDPALASFSGTDVFLPSVGLAQGIANWYTTIWVHNPGAVASYAQFYFLPRDQDNSAVAPSTGRIDPGETLLVRNLFSHDGFGAVRITASEPLLVTSRIYSRTPSETEKASKGQDFAGIPATFAIGAGQKSRLLGVSQTVPHENSELRYNFGFVETTGNACTVRVTPLDADGLAQVNGRTYDILPLGQHQYQFKNEFPSISTTNTVLEIEVISGTGRVIAFGSGITNVAQDPTTFEMQFAESLLGGDSGAGVTSLNAVTGAVSIVGAGATSVATSGNTITVSSSAAGTGDITSVTAGAGLSGGSQQGDVTLAIAGGGVTNAMLAANVVDASKIVDGSVGLNDLAPNSVSTGRIIDGTIVGDDIASGATLTVAKLQAGGTTAITTGVYGSATGGAGVQGNGVGASTVGVYGYSSTHQGVAGHSSSGTGVVGHSTSGTAIYGWTTDGMIGIQGETRSSNGNSIGVAGKSLEGIGIRGESRDWIGVWGESDEGIGIGGYCSSGPGVRGTSSAGYAVLGRGGSYAGYFEGDVHVTGTLSKAGGAFLIDHPLDPANRVLRHSFVESPDMKNVYDGVAVLDENGEAIVALPGYFEALNRDFRYQLTCIGGFAPLYIADEIADNRFRIAGGKAGMRVSWQVTGIRRDAYAEGHRIAVEEDKPSNEQGYYLHPELFGQPQERSVERVRSPEEMRRTAQPRLASRTPSGSDSTRTATTAP